MKISGVIITKDEETNIADAIASVSWADEIVVVDSGSTDKTRDIAGDKGAKVISREWLGFGRQKQFAAEQAENEWIFSLDADERVSGELKKEILDIKNSEPLFDGYRIPRLAFYKNRPIRHGGWHPDWQLRLFDRSKGRWKDAIIHESVQMETEAKIGKLSGDILHCLDASAANYHKMIGERYAPLAARQMFENGKRTSRLKIAIAAPAAFLQTYLLRAGFLDGFPGLTIAYFTAYHAFLKHLLLWEMNKN